MKEQEMNNKKINNRKKIIENFFPTIRYKTVESIPCSFMEKNNIKLILLDMDNTLISYETGTYNSEVKEWAERMNRSKIKMYILSNSPLEKKVRKIANELGMKFCYNSMKPLLTGIKKVYEKEKIAKENIVIIGDQVFTDVWVGNRFGIKSILVDRISNKERIHTILKRPFEKLILKKYSKVKGDIR